MTSAKDVDMADGISNRTILLEIKKGGLFAEDINHKKIQKRIF